MAETMEQRRGNHPPREKITLDTPVPEVPKKKLPAPNKKALDQQIASIEDEINDLKSKQTSVQQQLKDRRPGQKNTVNKGDMSEIITEKRRLREEIRKQNAILDSCRSQFKQFNEEVRVLKPKVKQFQSEQQIDAAIKDLQRRIEGSNVGIQEEKKLVQQLKELEQAKPSISIYAQKQQEANSNKDKFESAKKLREEAKGQLNELEAKESEINEQAQAKQKEVESAIPGMQDEATKLKDKIDELYEQKRSLIKSHKEKESAYKEQQSLIKQREFIIKTKERLEQKEKKQKEWEEREAERASQNPWAYEMSICDVLTQYLQRLAPDAGQARNEGEEEKKENSGNTDLGERILSRKEIEDMDTNSEGMFFAGKNKKKGKKQKTKQATEHAPLQHQLNILNLFNELGIKPPVEHQAIAECLQALKQKKEYFETNPERKQVAVEEQKQQGEKQTTAEFHADQEEDFPTLG